MLTKDDIHFAIYRKQWGQLVNQRSDFFRHRYHRFCLIRSYCHRPTAFRLLAFNMDTGVQIGYMYSN
jgi:hypothetical protein